MATNVFSTLEAPTTAHDNSLSVSLSTRRCSVHVHRQTAQQQIQEQQQSIESARTSILGFKRDFEREVQAMQVCCWYFDMACP